MPFVDYSMDKPIDWDEYCSRFTSDEEGWDGLPPSSQAFLRQLNLSSIYPHCKTGDFESDAPLMGPLLIHDYHSSSWQSIITLWFKVSPALLAMAELWLRLFAAAIAPLTIVYLLTTILSSFTAKTSPKTTTQSNNDKKKKKKKGGHFILSMACLLSVASSIILATDSFFVYEYHGPHYGLMLLLVSNILSLYSLFRHKSIQTTGWGILFLDLVFAAILLHQSSSNSTCNNNITTMLSCLGGSQMASNVSEGFYFNPDNDIMTNIHRVWNQNQFNHHGIEYTQRATPYLPTGDSRTGIPFLTNFWPDLTLTKVWLPTLDGEAVRLEIAFPPDGHDVTKTLYLALHGLSGGSQEEYLKDFTHRVNAKGHTVVIMIARGLMDTPLKGWNTFHGARTMDAAETARILSTRVRAPNQILAGVGYSMGAIILTNYVARAGPNVHLDVAMAISGGLDMRAQISNVRAKRLWEPLLAETLRDVFIVGKLGDRYRARLSKRQMLELMRASNVGLIDEHAVVTYNNYRDLEDYYSDMSAMGDIAVDAPASTSRIANISIPFCQVHALDDPLVTWQTIANNHQSRHPSTLVRTGSGNLAILLTRGGGHVGWPTGVVPSKDKWHFMSHLVSGFVESYGQVIDEQRKK